MTLEQQVRLGEITVWVGTAQELLQQAKSATYASNMVSVVPLTARTALTDALNDTTIAAGVLLPLVQKGECMSEDHTWDGPIEPTRAQLAARVAELEQENADLQRRLKIRDDLADALRAIYDDVPVSNWTRKPLRVIREWLASVGKQVPL